MPQLILKSESGGPKDRLTSELIFLGGGLNRQELNRRLKLLGLTVGQSAGYIVAEERILQDSGGLGAELWAKHIYNGCFSYPEELPDPKKMTLSEIVLLMNEAIVGWAEWIPAAMRDAVRRIAGSQAYSGPYDTELRARFRMLGFNTGQYVSFVANESLIINRLKWKKSEKEAWQESAILK